MTKDGQTYSWADKLAMTVEAYKTGAVSMDQVQEALELPVPVTFKYFAVMVEEVSDGRN